MVVASAADGTISFWNLACEAVTGYGAADVVGNPGLLALLYPDARYREGLLAERARLGHSFRDLELTLTCKDGTRRTVAWTAVASPDGDEARDRWVVGVDVTDARRAEQARRQSEERYRLLVQDAPIGIVSIDTTGRVLNSNPAFAGLIPVDDSQAARELNLLAMESLVESGMTADLSACMLSKQPGVFERRFSLPDARAAHFRYHVRPTFDAHGSSAGAQIIIEDFSQARRLEQQLQQAQKMEAIGTLAGGIAHDFNNILSAILGYTELADSEVADQELARHCLREVYQASRRAKDLVRQILAFSRMGDQELKPIFLGPIVKEALRLLRASLPSTIEIRQNLQATQSVVEADPTQVHQVLMNLCTNAAHAMHEEGGVLTVELVDAPPEGAYRTAMPELGPGGHIRLSVSDTGHGMPPAIIDRIFDPYFTTKAKGTGTGLGLAVVHGIVTRHHGAIAVRSAPGEGATFDIYLPKVERDVGEAIGGPMQVPRGTERILFVDDEPSLVMLAERMLERLGYTVTSCTNSLEALELFRSAPDTFDLVVTDMTMPGLTGDRLAREVLAIRPGMPVVLCTGYSELITEEQALDIGIRRFVMKPLAMREFCVSVREAIDGV